MNEITSVSASLRQTLLYAAAYEKQMTKIKLTKFDLSELTARVTTRRHAHTSQRTGCGSTETKKKRDNPPELVRAELLQIFGIRDSCCGLNRDVSDWRVGTN